MRNLRRVADNLAAAALLAVLFSLMIWWAWLLIGAPIHHWLTRDERAAAAALRDAEAKEASARVASAHATRLEALRKLGPDAVQVSASDRDGFRRWDVFVAGDRHPIVRVRASCLSLFPISLEGPGDPDAAPGVSASTSLSDHRLSQLGLEPEIASRLADALLEAIEWQSGCSERARDDASTR